MEIALTENYLCHHSSTFCSPKVEEALDKVKVSIRNLKEFRACFQEYKSRLPSYFTGDKIPKSWEFQVCLTVSGIFDLIFKLDVLL